MAGVGSTNPKHAGGVVGFHRSRDRNWGDTQHFAADFPRGYRRRLSSRALGGMGHVSALIGWGLQSLVFSLIIKPIGTAQAVTNAFATVSYVPDNAIPTSLDADPT